MDNMNFNDFREFGKAAIDFMADYLENIRERDVLPSVQPGFLHNLIPAECPENSEKWNVILDDIKNVIVPGITHWQSPNFHAYYPGETSFASIIGEMLSAGFGIVGFSWICSPSCTELEVIVMDWIAKFLKLPDDFLNSSHGPGGGLLQSSASEAILVTFLTAREQAVERLKSQHSELSESEIRGRLIAYSSDQSNSCIEKAGLLAAMSLKLLPTDNFVFRGNSLKEAVEQDIANGLFPIICIATLGTTGTCSFDNVEELSKVCRDNNIWLHIDAAYAGAALALPEYDFLRNGLDNVDSFNFNLHKLMRTNFDCCAMWFRNTEKLVDSFNVDRIYLKHDYQHESKKAPDYRNWEIPLGRRFRALKVWMTLRTYGADGMREFIRKHIELAERFEHYVQLDERFEMVAQRNLGLVCFRIKGDNKLSKELLAKLMDRKKIYLIEASHKDKHFLRFSICGFDPNETDIDFAWNEISNQTDILLKQQNTKKLNEKEGIYNNLNLITPSSNGITDFSTCKKNIDLLSDNFSNNLILIEEKKRK